MKENLRKEMDSDYPLIPMNEIDDEARILAVRWHENATNWIGDKHKLASDIMNYSRRKNLSLRTVLEEFVAKYWYDNEYQYIDNQNPKEATKSREKFNKWLNDNIDAFLNNEKKGI